MASRLLIVEDERDLAEPLAESLREEGYEVGLAASGEEARQKLNDHWDLLILDLMLPDISGEVLLSYLKQKPDYPSILILTAKGSVQDKLNLFRQGCDDYLTKPFIYEELLERVRALLRRSQRVQSRQLHYQDLSLDPDTFELQAGAQKTILTPKEAAILRLFLNAPEKVISRKEILENVWGLREEPNTNFIGVHLFNLRKKMGEVEREDWLQTVRSSGFLFGKPKDPHP